MPARLYLPHRPRSVVLLCMGPSVLDYLSATLTQELTPAFTDETWALNMSANTFNHDVCFWMDDLVNQNAFRSGLIELLRRRNKPVITCQRYPELVPTSYDYPIEDVSRIAIPVFGKPYLNNGVAMAIAYAIQIGVKVMKIYGADFSYPNRDFAESGRACVESWITLASVKGMQVQLCPNTSLMDNVKDDGIYGYAEQPTIDLGNGQMFRYVRDTDGTATRGKYRGGENVVHYATTGYRPEDSSRGHHGLPEAIPAGAVPPAASADQGPAQLVKPNGVAAPSAAF